MSVADLHDLCHRLSGLVDDEGKSPGPTGHGVQFQLNLFDRAVLFKVLLQVLVAGLPAQPTNKQLAILVGCEKRRVNMSNR